MAHKKEEGTYHRIEKLTKEMPGFLSPWERLVSPLNSWMEVIRNREFLTDPKQHTRSLLLNASWYVSKRAVDKTDANKPPNFGEKVLETCHLTHLWLLSTLSVNIAESVGNSVPSIWVIYPLSCSHLYLHWKTEVRTRHYPSTTSKRKLRHQEVPLSRVLRIQALGLCFFF